MTHAAPQTYILVHGAWHGGWCWERVAPRLRHAGHTVWTPDLPGHGENVSPFPTIRLADYVRCIETLARKSSQPVILGGHSMAGIVLTQVAENIPEKIGRLIYTSAFIPENGGSLMDEEKQTLSPSVSLSVSIDIAACSITLPDSPERIKELFYGQCGKEDVSHALSRLQKQPLQPFLDPISISETRFGRVPKLYIECLQDQAIRIEDQRRMHQRVGCVVRSLNTDHSPFFSADEALAKMLLESGVNSVSGVPPFRK